MVPGIVFCDVDGTLLDSRQEVQPGTVYAIHELQKKGIPFVINSARSPSGIKTVLQKYQLSCPMICYCGALILDENEKVLYSEGFSRETAGQIIQFIEAGNFDCTWNVYSVDTWIVKDRSDMRIRREEAIVNATAAEGSVYDLSRNAKVGKILCICNPDKISEIEKTLKAAFPDMSIARSSDILLEIMKNGITKSTGVRVLCRLWNIPVECTLAFGDQYNDIEMLETVAEPVLMGNAPAGMKSRFTNVTSGNDDEGICNARTRRGIIS